MSRNYIFYAHCSCVRVHDRDHTYLAWLHISKICILINLNEPFKFKMVYEFPFVVWFLVMKSLASNAYHLFVLLWSRSQDRRVGPWCGCNGGWTQIKYGIIWLIQGDAQSRWSWTRTDCGSIILVDLCSMRCVRHDQNGRKWKGSECLCDRRDSFTIDVKWASLEGEIRLADWFVGKQV